MYPERRQLSISLLLHSKIKKEVRYLYEVNKNRKSHYLPTDTQTHTHTYFYSPTLQFNVTLFDKVIKEGRSAKKRGFLMSALKEFQDEAIR